MTAVPGIKSFVCRNCELIEIQLGHKLKDQGTKTWLADSRGRTHRGETAWTFFSAATLLIQRQLRSCIHISFFMAWEEYGIWPLDDGFPFDFPLDKAGCHHYSSEAMIDVQIIKSLLGSILSGVNYLHLIVCQRPSLWVSPRTKNRVGLAQRRVRRRKWNWNLASGGQTGPTAGGRENLNWRQNTEYIGSQPGLAIMMHWRWHWGMSAYLRWVAGSA